MTKELINYALKNGSKDNISILIIVFWYIINEISIWIKKN